MGCYGSSIRLGKLAKAEDLIVERKQTKHVTNRLVLVHPSKINNHVTFTRYDGRIGPLYPSPRRLACAAMIMTYTNPNVKTTLRTRYD